MGEMVSGDSRPYRAVQTLAGYIRHAGGDGACVRRGGEVVERFKSSNKFPNSSDCSSAYFTNIDVIIFKFVS
ncbi:hypothetical protein KY290_018497 [Solanum tuberosum]|uniref:Uncharacterized protein n=1 Tax=Solanum tuberosum TaxID=4113 RepID=A0ABQ7VEG5_SOLTU|nr:hypothetical protein KY290_018497 [Solanum tuberosum]